MALSKHELSRGEKWFRESADRKEMYDLTLQELCTYLSALAKKADPKCDPMTQARLSIDHDYDDGTSCWVDVRRPETDEEWKDRVELAKKIEAEQRQWESDRRKQRLAAERAEYERLKKKFEKKRA